MKLFTVLFPIQLALILFYFVYPEDPSYIYSLNWIAGVLAGTISVIIIVAGFNNLKSVRANKLLFTIFLINIAGLLALLLYWFYLKWQLNANYS